MIGVPGFTALPGLVHGVSTRQGGVSPAPFDSLNIGSRSIGSLRGDAPEHVRENRRRIAAALGFTSPPVLPHQVHGTRIAVVHDADDAPGEADGLVTDRPGVLLGVLGADCPGLVLVAADMHVVAVLHAGWRGVVGGIVGAALSLLRDRFALAPASLHVGIGPGISAARYEVSADVADAVRDSLGADAKDAVARVVLPGRPGHAHVDLVAAIEAQLASGGVVPEHVMSIGSCTFDEPATWFSHRRDGPRTGRHGLFAGFLP